MVLPQAPVERVLRAAGAKRVSAEATKALAEVLEEVGADIATQAVKLAQHAKRTTVTAADVKMASR